MLLNFLSAHHPEKPGEGRGHWEGRNFRYVGYGIIDHDMVWVRDESFEELSELNGDGTPSKNKQPEVAYSETITARRACPKQSLGNKIVNLFK